jgi:hypothetical protein
MAVRQFDVEERRARLGLRHRLAPSARAGTLAEVARSLVAVHSTDAASVVLAARARLRDPDAAAIEDELYRARTVVRMLGMRRTMFVVPVDIVPIVQSGAARQIALRERALLLRMIEGAGIAANAARWLARAEAATIEALRARGEATAAELAADVPALRERIRMAAGKRYEGSVGVSTRLLFLLAAEGQVVRGRPRGSWISSQYRWALADSWLGSPIPEVPVPEARAELVRRWLLAYGPARETDVRWWTAWAMGTRRALAALDVVEVDLDGEPGLALADDLEPTKELEPWAALLPALDPTVMGWRERSWFLGDLGPRLFDRSGNAGPTVWWCGRVVGGWAQRPDGEIRVQLLEDAGEDARAAIDAEGDRLASWMGPVRVTPRFRTPLERELSS